MEAAGLGQESSLRTLVQLGQPGYFRKKRYLKTHCLLLVSVSLGQVTEQQEMIRSQTTSTYSYTTAVIAIRGVPPLLPSVLQTQIMPGKPTKKPKQHYSWVYLETK